MRYLSIALQITLSCNEDHINVCLASLLDLVDPGLDVVETDRVRNRIGEYDAVCPLVERFGDISKSFLTSSIPNVQRDLITIKLNPLYLEVHTNSTQVL
jgi:hypothetical protein